MDKMISNIVFTKNRPMQLEAYLQSLYKYFPDELIQTYIIYKVELFADEYKSLFHRYPNCIVIEEGDFHSDCVKVISEADTKYILFGIDDVVFFDSVDINLIDQIFNERKEDIFGFTLRFGRESPENSKDVISEVEIDNQKVYNLNWKNGQTAHSRYPFELCCTIYTTELVKRIISSVMNNNAVIKRFFCPDSFLIKGLQGTKLARKLLKSFGYFFSPNTLESWNCRWCQEHVEELPNFTYFQKLCAAPIQVNMVNTSTKNTFDGTTEHTVEALNDRYRQGYKLDIDFIASKKPTSLSCGREYFKLVECGQRVS
jgi:hypothetical protein